jgi:hypothetical protein
MSSGRSSTLSLWIGRFISLLPVLLLLFSAFAKITQQPQVMEGFAKYGFDERVIRPLGITEVVCTILYLIPQTSVLGAILLTGYLGGATCTHVRAEEAKFIVPAMLGVLVWLGLFFRDNRIRALIPFKKP